MKPLLYALLGFLTGSWLVDQYIIATREPFNPWQPAIDCDEYDVPIIRDGVVNPDGTVTTTSPSGYTVTWTWTK